MRHPIIAALLMLAGALAGADVRQLGPNEDLPYCRVVMSGSDNGRPVTSAHDGWWSPNTYQLFPLKVPVADLTHEYTMEPATIVSVTPAAAQPRRMPSEWRKMVNEYVARHHPKMPEPAPTAAAAKP